MPDPDICKGGKAGHKCPKCGTRHQSVRQYVNRNKPIVSPAPDWLPGGDDDDQDMNMVPDETKATGNAYQPGGRDLAAARVSPSRVTPHNHQAASSGDHGGFADPMNQPGPLAQALAHQNMRQGVTTPVPLMTQSTSFDSFPRDLRSPGSGVAIGLERLGAYEAAGAPDFRAQPSGSPVRPMDHQSRGSATGPTPGHSLSNPGSTPPMACKDAGPLRGTEALAAMKRHLYGSGGAR